MTHIKYSFQLDDKSYQFSYFNHIACKDISINRFLHSLVNLEDFNTLGVIMASFFFAQITSVSRK